MLGVIIFLGFISLPIIAGICDSSPEAKARREKMREMAKEKNSK